MKHSKEMSCSVSAGKNKSGLDVSCDMQRVNRDINNNPVNSDPTTTEHESIEEALWFAVNVAYNHNSFPIHKIAIFDFCKNSYLKKVIETIDKLKLGWEPD